MLSAKASEAVREAVKSPTGPEADGFEAGGGRERRQPRQRPKQQQQRRRQQSGGRDATESNSGVAGRSQSKSRARGGRASGAAGGGGGGDDERAARGEVGDYVPPGGSVELGMFGKKLVSFGQVTLLYHACGGLCGLHGSGGEGRGGDS